MDFYMNTIGNTTPCIREYETDITEDVKKGTIVTLTNGKVTIANASSTILGVLADDFYAEKDELIPNSGTGRMRVIITPNATYRMPLIEAKISETGSNITIKATSLNLPSVSNALKGGYVKLISKGPTSQNTDNVGCARKITSSSGTSIGVEKGGVSDIQDIYAIIPPAGFAYIDLDQNAEKFVFSSTECTFAKVASSLPENNFTEFVFTKTFFN